MFYQQSYLLKRETYLMYIFKMFSKSVYFAPKCGYLFISGYVSTEDPNNRSILSMSFEETNSTNAVDLASYAYNWRYISTTT